MQIKALFEEVKRLRSVEQTHLIQIHRLEEHLEAKRQHIMRLESKLNKQQINEALQESQHSQQAENAADEEEEEDVDKDCEMLEVSETAADRVTEDDENEVQEIVKERNCDLTPRLSEKPANDEDDEEEEDIEQNENNQNSADIEQCAIAEVNPKELHIKKETQ